MVVYEQNGISRPLRLPGMMNIAGHSKFSAEDVAERKASMQTSTGMPNERLAARTCRKISPAMQVLPRYYSTAGQVLALCSLISAGCPAARILSANW
jgi:hypothetical protein